MMLGPGLHAQLSRIYKEYPHHVHVVNFTNDLMWDWLTYHVGPRHVNWELPTSNKFVFKHVHHAVQFSLIWSGT